MEHISKIIANVTNEYIDTMKARKEPLSKRWAASKCISDDEENINVDNAERARDINNTTW